MHGGDVLLVSGLPREEDPPAEVLPQHVAGFALGAHHQARVAPICEGVQPPVGGLKGQWLRDDNVLLAVDQSQSLHHLLLDLLLGLRLKVPGCLS